MSNSPPFFSLSASNPKFETNGIRHATVKSRALGQRADITFWIPDSSSELGDLPIVLLLHGVYGSHWDWVYQGGVHQTAERLINTGQISPMILAMPSDGLCNSNIKNSMVGSERKKSENTFGK